MRHNSPQRQQREDAFVDQRQQQQRQPIQPMQPSSRRYESEEDEDDDVNDYQEERDTFDEHQFGDSSVLFQSPSQFNGEAQQHQQFTLNPHDRGNSNGNSRYMAS